MLYQFQGQPDFHRIKLTLTFYNMVLQLLPDLILFPPDGSPTSRYREIYHMEEGD